MSAVADLSASRWIVNCLCIEGALFSDILLFNEELFIADLLTDCFKPLVFWAGCGILELVLLALCCANACLWLLIKELTPLANWWAFLEVEALDGLGGVDADLCPTRPLAPSAWSWWCSDATECAGLDCFA